MTLQLKPLAYKKIQQGQRLLQVEDLEHPFAVDTLQEGEVVLLESPTGDLAAKALIGRQNKGLGWIFTLDSHAFWDQDFITTCFTEAIDRRETLFNSESTTAFRLFNGEGDGIGGFTVDWYGGFIQINWYSKGIFSYRDLLVSCLIEQLPKIQGVYETKRFKTKDNEWQIKHTYGHPAPHPLVIKENDLRFAIYLGEEWMTGLFLDQREVRQFVNSQSLDLDVLNLFSYTGGFSVAAAVGGARKTVSVDVANRSLPKTKEQFDLNGIYPDTLEDEIRVMDVFDYIHYANRHEIDFDLVVCDPPSFARTKDYQFVADQDYKALAHQVFNLTRPGGMAILSTNHSGYSLEDFQQGMVEVGLNHPGMCQLIQSFDLPMDFPTTMDEASQYLKVLVFYRAQ